MAKDESQNPFSFQKFVSKKSKGDLTSQAPDAEIDIFDLPDVQEPQVQEQNQSTSNEDVPGESASKVKSSNPFSFKKFLTKDSNISKTGVKVHAEASNEKHLPDFTSDLPDFDSPVTHNTPFHEEVTSSLPDFTSRVDVLPQVSDSVSQLDYLTLNNGMADSGQKHLDLPDFLSDNAVHSLSLHDDNDDENDENDDFISGVLNGSQDVSNVAKENAELKKSLLQAEEKSHLDSQRLAELQLEIKRIKKRESEDTKALEEMMQQVEANLQSTTKRAVKAEGLVAKLKEDIQVLQQENAALRSGDLGIESMREKAKYASQQLNTAATGAEQQLKQLLSGVDQLKMLSQILSTIDKFTEEQGPSTCSDSGV